MATKAWWAAAALVLAACGGGGDEAAAADSAAMADKARIDSIRAARKVRDSLAAVRYSACSDSVLTVLKSTPAGRKMLAKPPADGAPFAEVTAACGAAKTLASAVSAATGSATAAVAATNAATAAKQDVAPAAQAPAPAAAAPAPAPAGPTAAQQALQAKAQQKAEADAAARTAQRKAMQDSIETAAAEAARADSLKEAADRRVVREVFAYGGGTRDPFASAIKRKTVGPELVDLTLVGVLEDPRAPSRSVATFRDKRTGKRHSVRQGDQLGRNRVLQIRDKDVVFSVFDFGVERRETLTLRKQEDVTP